ncbi:hypothetical protein, partial [Methanocalculus sp.]|uniref:hypothetical protein n=1 Tax=Methanocalculus sp. TaxID=2004547 RepID=UPI00263152C0
PKSNAGDVLIEERYREMIEIIPVSHIEEILEQALVPTNRAGFLAKLKKLAEHAIIPPNPPIQSEPGVV